VPGVRSVVDTTYYDAEGSDRRQWMSSMRANARRAGVSPPYVAYTRTQARWTYTSSRSSTGGCQTSLPAVEVNIRYIVPRLVADTVDEEDMLEWRRYLVSLWRHEEGHGIRALREASEMRDSLSSVRTTSCAALNASVNRALDAVSRKYRRLQNEYDTRTGHGARQGAILLMPGAVRLAIDTTYRDTIP
jgi:predicted secreted Zn-dependent protease